MRTFPLIVSSPMGEVFRGEVVAISLRGIEGDLAILAGHTPFITAVKPCNCVLTLEDGTEKTGYTDGGLLTVSQESTTLLSGTFDWK